MPAARITAGLARALAMTGVSAALEGAADVIEAAAPVAAAPPAPVVDPPTPAPATVVAAATEAPAAGLEAPAPSGTGGGAPAPAPTVPAVAAPSADLFAHVQGELRTERDAVARLTAELTQARTTLAQHEAELPALRATARAACERMAVPLNASAALATIETMDGVALSGLFNNLTAQLEAKYPVGPQSQSTAKPVTVTDAAALVVPIAAAAAIKATQQRK